MKTVLITGASKGIGCEIAREFANNGYSVAINYNKSETEANKLYNYIINNGGNAILVKADISNPNEVSTMVEYTLKCFGHIDVLVNNAGVCVKNLIIDEQDDITKNVIEINLLGSIYTSKYVLKSMVQQGFGKIINISSIWGNCGAACEATYSASKSGIIGLTKSLAKEYGYNNINVNCICPGLVETNMNKNLSEQELLEIIENIPQKRMARPKEVAKLALFLADQTGDYITGQIITIDGGFTL